MQRCIATDCLEKIGKEVRLSGWVQTVRAHGKIAFFDLRDRSGTIQIIGTKEAVVAAMSTLSQQDVVAITGTVKQREERYVNLETSTGSIEIEAAAINVLSKAQTMPFDMGGKDLHLELPTLLDYRSLTLRHPVIAPIFKVQEAIVEGFRDAAKKLECTEIFVPTIASNATEGGAEVFSLDYYHHKAFLIQSPQLNKQMLVPVFERVYTISHAYRAEPSVTTRHLAETIQLDCEFGFVTFGELLDLFEQVAKEMISYAREQNKTVLEKLQVKEVALGKIPRLTLREAQEILFKETGRDVRAEKDLSPQDEIDISAWALKTHKSDLVTITHFPTKKRAFYTMPDPENPEYSLSYDMLFRGIEIMSGSQRINQYDELVKAIKDRNLNPKNFAMYLQAFAYGMPPEGGFSFGLERITMKMLQLKNIREASLYPRDMERVDERFSIPQASSKED